MASSEIYATWPQASITANVLAIMSFTLNRVYTEWYRNKGYDFTITSSTAFDHKWIYGRNIYESISRIVDEIFNNYLSRPEVRQPKMCIRDRDYMAYKYEYVGRVLPENIFFITSQELELSLIHICTGRTTTCGL